MFPDCKPEQILAEDRPELATFQVQQFLLLDGTVEQDCGSWKASNRNDGLEDASISSIF